MTDGPGHIDPKILARLFDGSLTEEDRTRLRTAAAADPELANEIRDIERLGDIMPGTLPLESSPPAETDIDAAWERVAERAGIQTTSTAGQPSGRDQIDRSTRARSSRKDASPGFTLHRLPVRLAVAASVVLVAVVGILLLRPTATGEQKTLMTERGQTASLSLVDGTDVLVNADSRIEYDVDERLETRRVVLEGEARFIVNPDGRPFVVETPQATIRVLGTRFTVRSRGETTRVAVQEGRVSVSSDSFRTELSVLEALDVSSSALFTRLGTDVAGAADDWTEGTMSFRRAPLTEVVLDIERRYDVVVRLDGQWLGTESLTGSFPGLDARDTLESVCRTFDCDVRRTEDGFVLTR